MVCKVADVVDVADRVLHQVRRVVVDSQEISTSCDVVHLFLSEGRESRGLEALGTALFCHLQHVEEKKHLSSFDDNFVRRG